MTKTTDWMQLISGAPFWPLEPDIERIEIEDIAHALSMQCRFAGHVTRFYSVAEHCVHVSHAVPLEDALWGLLHDAAEAYLVDLPRPVKPFLHGYRDAETRLLRAVAARFGLAPEMPQSVHEADNRILMNERDALLASSHIPWGWNAQPLPDVVIQGWEPGAAKAHFLHYFYELTFQQQAAIIRGLRGER